MRRKQFIDQLTKISELNGLNSIHEVPMFCCKQYKINQRVNRNTIRTQTQGSQQNIVSQPKVVTQWREKSRPSSAVSSQGSQQRRGKVIKTIASIGNQKEAHSIMDISVDVEKLNKAIVIKADLSEKHNEQMISFKDKKTAKEIPIYRRHIINSSVSSTSAANQQDNKRLSFTETSTPADKPKSGRILCINSVLFKKGIDQSPSIKNYNSMKGSQQKVVPTHLDRQMKLALRKEINNNYRKPFNPPPKITAKSYIVYEIKSDSNQSSIITSFNAKSSQEVASLTKIMTCIVVLEICQQMNVDIYSEEVLIGKMESSIGGTTAHLQKGQIYTVKQLLYGLMLPSGNDASLALAVWTGKILLKRDTQNWTVRQLSTKRSQSLPLKKGQTVTCEPSSPSRPTKHQFYARFILQMNRKAKSLKMTKTNYANSHGLINCNNKSSAYDVALLSEYALKNDMFRKIVSTRHFKCMVKVNLDQCRSTKDISSQEDDEPQGVCNKIKINLISKRKVKDDKKIPVEWQNTQKLLKNTEYIGIKTGYTTAAGPCLASCVSIKGRQFIIVVLSCSRMTMRFRQTEILRKWLYKHEGLKKTKKKGQKQQEDEQNEDFLKEQAIEFPEIVPDNED